MPGVERTIGSTVNRDSDGTFLGVASLLFVACSIVTVVWCASMSSMGGMPMPGGWTMSMAWMRMPGQSWPGAAAAFLGMWIVMMVAMMLPALVPMLRRYRAAVGPAAGARLGSLTLRAGVGYFAMWTLIGGVVFLLGAAFATLTMSSPELARFVPLAGGLIVIAGGALQFTAWKSRLLACCRDTPGRGAGIAADGRTAWIQGVRFGVHCVSCCMGLTAILLVLGVMDLRAMALVTVAICLERLQPAGRRAARSIGIVMIAAGIFMAVRAIRG